MRYSVVTPRRKEVSLCLAENTTSARKMPVGFCLLGKIIVVDSENPYETHKYKCLGSGTCVLLTTGLLSG